MREGFRVRVTPKGAALVEAMMGGSRPGAEAADLRFTVIAKHIAGEPLTRDERAACIRLGVDLHVTEEAVAAFNAL